MQGRNFLAESLHLPGDPRRSSDDGGFIFGLALPIALTLKDQAKRMWRFSKQQEPAGTAAVWPTSIRMTSRKTTRKAKKVLPVGWVAEESFEVPANVRPAAEPRGPAHHVLFTPPGSSDTTIEVRRP